MLRIYMKARFSPANAGRANRAGRSVSFRFGRWAAVEQNMAQRGKKTESAGDESQTTGESEETRHDSRRQSVVDRRSGVDRRSLQEQEQAEREATNLERRRGPGRRRSDFLKAADEGEMTQEQFLFVMAIDTFKRVNAKTFPSWTDVLEVIRKLGYRKTQKSELNLGKNVEDWMERADAPAGVSKVESGNEEREE